MAPPNIKRLKALELDWEMGKAFIFPAKISHSFLVKIKRQLSNPRVTIAPPFKAARNLAGTANLPLSSIKCWYSPMNIYVSLHQLITNPLRIYEYSFIR